MTRPQLVVHGHFYQPPRIDPFTGVVPADSSAAPSRDWNARVSEDCYRRNAEVGNLEAISWDLGPTLTDWMEDGDPIAYRGFVARDAAARAMAQPFHHSILPLAAAEDRRTEIRWGLRDAEHRFGRLPTGLWLPETAVDLATLRLAAQEGITHTILAPWQVEGHAADGSPIDTRRPYRVDLGGGSSMVVVLYDGLLSASISFEPWATIDADAFVRDRLVPRFADEPTLPDDAAPLVVIATDGELYGHHQRDREHFLARLVGRTMPADVPYDVVELATFVEGLDRASLPEATLRDATSWSCHHGLGRWSADCGCVPDGSWKAPLRAALDRLAGGIDAVAIAEARSLPGSPDLWLARDAYVDVVIGAQDAVALAAAHLGPGAGPDDRRRLLDILDAQRWRLAMYSSCGWFWESHDRPETFAIIRAATYAARTIDRLAGTRLEETLERDLAGIGRMTVQS